jgi:hypothetical protein
VLLKRFELVNLAPLLGEVLLSGDFVLPVSDFGDSFLFHLDLLFSLPDFSVFA